MHFHWSSQRISSSVCNKSKGCNQNQLKMQLHSLPRGQNKQNKCQTWPKIRLVSECAFPRILPGRGCGHGRGVGVGGGTAVPGNIIDMWISAGAQCRRSLIKNCRATTATSGGSSRGDNNKLLRHYVACSMTMTRTWHVCETSLTRCSALATATDRQQRELPQMPPAKHFTCLPHCPYSSTLPSPPLLYSLTLVGSLCIKSLERMTGLCLWIPA